MCGREASLVEIGDLKSSMDRNCVSHQLLACNNHAQARNAQTKNHQFDYSKWLYFKMLEWGKLSRVVGVTVWHPFYFLASPHEDEREADDPSLPSLSPTPQISSGGLRRRRCFLVSILLFEQALFIALCCRMPTPTIHEFTRSNDIACHLFFYSRLKEPMASKVVRIFS